MQLKPSEYGHEVHDRDRGIAERVLLRGDTMRGRVATFEITPKMQLVASCVAECIQHLNRLDERFNYLCTHDYGGRPVQSP